jgi:hypothetical protein
VLIKFLQENRDIFSWKYAGMPGVPRKLIERELHLDPKAKPIKQQLRCFAQDKKKRCNKERDTYIVRPWLHQRSVPPGLPTNPIVVPKKNKDWRVCVDYTDLNKACKKDSFALS